jgi:hypothetical protein
LKWYEAIFGKEMWKHVITETTFWSHRESADTQRKQTRGNLDEELQEKLWKEKFHTELNVPRDIRIPGVFIDPVVNIFADPCNSNFNSPEKREIEKFTEYTDK